MINRSQNEIKAKWPDKWDKPLVSIRCLAYNHARFIKDALDGFLMQETTFPFEIVIHDDASTDETASIIREYEKNFPDIVKPIYESENLYSKNDGSLDKVVDGMCQGKYIAFCEGDDYWTSKDKLQKQVEILERDDSVSMVHSDFDTVDEDGVKIVRSRYTKFRARSLKENALITLFKTNYIMTLSTVLRREVFFSEILEKCPFRYDYALFFSAAFMGKIKYIPLKMGAYRKNPSSLMQTKKRQVSSAIADIYKYFALHYDSNMSNNIFSHIQIVFWILYHMLFFRDYSTLKKIMNQNPIGAVILPFCFFRFILSNLKNACIYNAKI